MARKSSFDEEQLTDSAYYILLTLVEEQHGYSIMQNIEELTDGELKIGPASLYTILKKMQSAEMINQIQNDNDRRKVYTITDKGRTVLLKEVKRRIRMAEHGKTVLNLLEGRSKNEA
ncbi:PadR family transcriptional regulator [Oceanirhabdus sp. W0125-5]|uniref:PadR family transcriptional regulator n=1 Tax=Oceanirhabdus sp. W0125-5 TaxID=2999116 RepID=UPI0022F33FEF|nr:PadR family transcriptional regulator [Oceanirhabdus sp. W0125-5]WBW97839.1 PadR family transcriptional regulator [Oceanirhabdus sp. W0125-5]